MKEKVKKMTDKELAELMWEKPYFVQIELTRNCNYRCVFCFENCDAEKKYEDMPIIMVTTEGGKAEVITALKAGVNNYIVKPFTPQVLKEKLEDVLGTGNGDSEAE